MVNFGIATNRYYKDRDGNRQEETEFHNIVAFSRTAEIVSQYLSKGDLALIEGRIQTRSWEDQKSGQRRYKTEIVADNIQLPPRSMSSDGGGAPAGSSGDTSSQAQENDSRQTKNSDDEDVPVLQIEEDASPEANNNNDNNDDDDNKESNDDNEDDKNSGEIDPEKDINL